MQVTFDYISNGTMYSMNRLYAPCRSICQSEEREYNRAIICFCRQQLSVIGWNKSRDLFQSIAVAACKNKWRSKYKSKGFIKHFMIFMIFECYSCTNTIELSWNYCIILKKTCQKKKKRRPKTEPLAHWEIFSESC